MRKIQHLLCGFLTACFPWIFSSPKEVAELGVALALILLICKKARLLSSLHEVSRKTSGEFYFILATTMLAFLSWNQPIAFYLIPILILTLSDALAALIGTAYKKAIYSIRGHSKSFEGSTVFFICTFLTVHLPLLFLSDFEPIQSVLIAIHIAIVTTFVEAVSGNGIDNLFVPLISFGLLLHLSQISTGLIAGELLSMVLFALGFLLRCLIFRRSLFSIHAFDLSDPRMSYFSEIRSSLYPGSSEEEFISPDAICLAACEKKTPLAVLTIRLRGDLGTIGHYEALSEEAGVHLLRKAQKELASMGAKTVLGPMNGNTWNRYRLALEPPSGEALPVFSRRAEKSPFIPQPLS